MKKTNPIRRNLAFASLLFSAVLFYTYLICMIVTAEMNPLQWDKGILTIAIFLGGMEALYAAAMGIIFGDRR